MLWSQLFVFPIFWGFFVWLDFFLLRRGIQLRHVSWSEKKNWTTWVISNLGKKNMKMKPSLQTCEDSGCWSGQTNGIFLCYQLFGEKELCIRNEEFIQVKDLTGNTCLVVLMVMCFQQKKILCGFMFFQLVKITCWMGFSNLVFTRQRHL